MGKVDDMKRAIDNFCLGFSGVFHVLLVFAVVGLIILFCKWWAVLIFAATWAVKRGIEVGVERGIY